MRVKLIRRDLIRFSYMRTISYRVRVLVALQVTCVIYVMVYSAGAAPRLALASHICSHPSAGCRTDQSSIYQLSAWSWASDAPSGCWARSSIPPCAQPLLPSLLPSLPTRVPKS